MIVIAGLGGDGLGEDVLALKEHFQRSTYVCQCPAALVVGGEQGDQHIGVMSDLVQVKLVCVIAWVQGSVIVQLVFQRGLHPGVRGLRAQHIRVGGGIGGAAQPG